jgi:hypothetical protein
MSLMQIRTAGGLVVRLHSVIQCQHHGNSERGPFFSFSCVSLLRVCMHLSMATYVVGIQLIKY